MSDFMSDEATSTIMSDSQKKNTVGADPAETRFMSNPSFEKKFYE